MARTQLVALVTHETESVASNAWQWTSSREKWSRQYMVLFHCLILYAPSLLYTGCHLAEPFTNAADTTRAHTKRHFTAQGATAPLCYAERKKRLSLKGDASPPPLLPLCAVVIVQQVSSLRHELPKQKSLCGLELNERFNSCDGGR